MDAAWTLIARQLRVYCHIGVLYGEIHDSCLDFQDVENGALGLAFEADQPMMGLDPGTMDRYGVLSRQTFLHGLEEDKGPRVL